MSTTDSTVRGPYHTRVTLLCLMWAAMAVVLHVWLTRRRFAPWLKYVVSIGDAFMITILCTIAGGPKTPLVLLYFPLIAAAPLRLSLKLVYVTTACAIAGYLCLLGMYAWYWIGFTKYYSTPELRIPRSTEAIVILALLVTGLLAGQFVRQARRIAGRSPVVVTVPQE
jgi:eukaryotic-like serine/threonine-protein kinase